MAVLALTFKQDNPCNTTILADDAAVLYTVATSFADADKPVTYVHTPYGERVAEWEWRDARSDILTLGMRPQVSASAWLKKSIIPYKGTVTFKDDLGVEYKWTNNLPGQSLQLYGPQSKTEPIARFVRARKGQPQPSMLLLDECAKRMRDMVVVSFLLLERRRRESEVETSSRAAALAIPLATLSCCR
ncbi:hypothetical protein FA95DRAFT_1575239 [Auriscalpium vulgare]|uniref:Uncharacterized protein n=1 Tax=Auriscalpium vulgare TaxID=40419 RepID=A0ACB8RHP6_9AGAM|nr:hypothetical protein FA95DRAFT_1575239 [Auriscalpium vulgare]